MTMRFLISSDGSPFRASDISAFRETLDSYSDKIRVKFRNCNSSAIAQYNTERCLIVSGPGTGKSHLFLDKINYWYQSDQDAKVIVTSFVRKLVADLQADIKCDDLLTNHQKSRITVSTLHKLARSIVETNHGTAQWPFKPYFRIIGQFWKGIVWNDVLAFFPRLNSEVYTLKLFEKQLHDNSYEQSEEWRGLKKSYLELCKYYNAAGFADLILRAAKALKENPSLNENHYFIIDEYQDFNLAEEAFINQLACNPKGMLVVGDDEQVLYDDLKSGKATLIRNLYKNNNYVNGMLPFCSRSSFHITKTADHFIQNNREEDSIDKIYLPIKSDSDGPKVHVIACATPQTAVDYLEKFVKDNQLEVDERKQQLDAGDAKDAYLLILSPTREVNYFGQSKDIIKSLVAKYQTEARAFSEDYYQLLSYYSLASNPNNNFTFRKVLHYQAVPQTRIHELLTKGITDSVDLFNLDDMEIKSALSKCYNVKAVLDNNSSLADKLDQISLIIPNVDKTRLQSEMERVAINEGNEVHIEHDDEEDAELDEIEVKKMGAVELMTIVGSKGLSADHVIIIGFDDVNMRRISKNAFYVAITRARKSLHLLTALKSGGATEAHSYLDQLPDDHVEFYSYKKQSRTKTVLSDKQEFKNWLININSISRRQRYVS